MMVIVPVDRDHGEAQHVIQEYRQHGHQCGEIGARRYFEVQHHDGDDDGDDAVAEGLEPRFAHHHKLLPIRGGLRVARLAKPTANRWQRCPLMTYCVYSHTMEHRMSSTTFTVRVDREAKRRLEKLARSTGRSRSFLAAEAINEYLNLNEWQVEGIKKAVSSLDETGGVPHEEVKAWVKSWGAKKERRLPGRR